MSTDRSPFPLPRWEHHLLVLSGVVAVACLAYVEYSPRSVLPELPVVAVPLAVSFGLGLFTVRLQRQGYGSDQLGTIVKCGYAGALASAAVSGWWIALYLHRGLPVGGLADQILTVLSGGIGAGVLVGRSAIGTRREPSTSDRDRDRLLDEVSWVNRSGSTPILDAVVESLADLEGVDPLELDPLHDHVDPDVLAELRTGSDSQWQFLFYVDGYEVRVSSHGTVTVYDADPREVPALSTA